MKPMRKIQQYIKLRKFINDKNKKALESLKGFEFLIWYQDNTCKDVLKDDLIYELKNDREKPIRYIFDMQDRIIVERKIIIEGEIGNGT